jgi:predicted nucleic acid-binding protein
LVAVVSDAGPLIHLARIHKVPLLKKLFDIVLVAEKVKVEVFDEGVRLGYADAETVGKALADCWLRVEPFPERLVESAVKLAEGENISLSDAETLLLAVDKKAELLVDDKLLFDLAKMYRLKVWNTWTLLLESLKKGYLELDELRSAVDKLDKMKFRLNAKQAQEILDAANSIETHKKDRK